MVRHGTLDSLMKILSHVTLSNAMLASRAGSWDNILHCYTVWSNYCTRHCQNSIVIRDVFETKLQLYFDDNELQNISVTLYWH